MQATEADTSAADAFSRELSVSTGPGFPFIVRSRLVGVGCELLT